jgi:hypothetical protein
VVVNELDQYVSEEHPTLDEAINDATDRAQRGGPHAVVELQYEFVDSSLVWTPNGTDRWPPQNARFRRVGIQGEYRFLCPTDLCPHLFRGQELVPGETIMCPECGAMLPVAKDFKVGV